MFTHLISSDGTIICSNLPHELLSEFNSCDQECEYQEKCPVFGRSKRHGRIVTPQGILYACTYDSSITKKIFKRHLDSLFSLFDSLIKSMQEIKKNESEKVKRFEHNIVTYHKKIQEELDDLIPDLSINNKNWRMTLDAIGNSISNARNVPISLLHILKNMKLIKAEIDLFDMFRYDDIELNVGKHSIHKIVNLALQAFWIDFIEKDIHINIGNSYDNVWVDYTSFSVALGHIFDNATKYTLPKNEIDITFKSIDSTVIFEISMVSICVEDDEIEKLFEEKYSGKWSKELGLQGYGIGMYYVKKIMDLNKGNIEFIPSKKVFLMEKIPYCNNTIRITLPLCAD